MIEVVRGNYFCNGICVWHCNTVLFVWQKIDSAWLSLDFDMYRFLLQLFFCFCVFKIHEGHLICSDDVSMQVFIINQAVM